MKSLPKLNYKGTEYFVDFRLGEMRNINTLEPIKFVDLKEDVNSDIKKNLRSLRFQHWHNEYVEGVDD